MFVLLQLKRSEDNIHESIQIKERLISELEHVEKQAANENAMSMGFLCIIEPTPEDFVSGLFLQQLGSSG